MKHVRRYIRSVSSGAKHLNLVDYLLRNINYMFYPAGEVILWLNVAEFDEQNSPLSKQKLGLRGA